MPSNLKYKVWRYAMKKILTLGLMLASFGVFAGSAVSSYLDGTRKVCVYEDGYEVSVGITDQCPLIAGH